MILFISIGTAIAASLFTGSEPFKSTRHSAAWLKCLTLNDGSAAGASTTKFASGGNHAIDNVMAGLQGEPRSVELPGIWMRLYI